jgi:hypothetical protein
VLSLCIPSGVHADDEDDPTDSIRIPAVRPAKNFYGGAGTGVKIEASAKPTELTIDGWITYSLKFTNLVNAKDVEKPKLSALDDFNRNFQVDDQQSDPVWKPNQPGQRMFIYRLRPRSVKVDSIPQFTFSYFDPKRKVPQGSEEKAYATTWTSTIRIEVQPAREPPPAAAVPLQVPAFAASTGTHSDLLQRGSGFQWTVLLGLLALVLPVAISIIWVILWKRKYPDAAKLARQMRSRAARKAWAALHRAPDALAISSAVSQYLHDRYDLSAANNTPAEIRGNLVGLGFNEEVVGEVESLYTECDMLRFAPASDISHEELAQRAAGTIAKLEEST